MEQEESASGDRLAAALEGLKAKPAGESLAQAVLEAAAPLPKSEDHAESIAQFRALRKALGLTAKELGALIHVNPRTINAWEGGKSPVDATAWLLLQILFRHPTIRKWVEQAKPTTD